MKRPRLPRSRRGRVAVGIVSVLLLAAALGPFVYAWITDSPAPFSSRRFGDPTTILVEELEGPWTVAEGSQAGKALRSAGVTPQTLNGAINEIRKGRTADSPTAEMPRVRTREREAELMSHPPRPRGRRPRNAPR